MISKKSLGAIGEKRASSFLKKNGFKILKKNFKTSFGEIDIIAMKKEVIHFIEVKTRSHNDYDSAVNAIDTHKMRHIARTAEWFLEHYHKNYAGSQIDACIVLFKEEQNPTIHLLENIYEG
jgi:putative endonuclease